MDEKAVVETLKQLKEIFDEPTDENS